MLPLVYSCVVALIVTDKLLLEEKLAAKPTDEVAAEGGNGKSGKGGSGLGAENTPHPPLTRSPWR